MGNQHPLTANGGIRRLIRLCEEDNYKITEEEAHRYMLDADMDVEAAKKAVAARSNAMAEIKRMCAFASLSPPGGVIAAVAKRKKYSVVDTFNELFAIEKARAAVTKLLGKHHFRLRHEHIYRELLVDHRDPRAAARALWADFLD